MSTGRQMFYLLSVKKEAEAPTMSHCVSRWWVHCTGHWTKTNTHSHPAETWLLIWSPDYDECRSNSNSILALLSEIPESLAAECWMRYVRYSTGVFNLTPPEKCVFADVLWLNSTHSCSDVQVDSRTLRRHCWGGELVMLVVNNILNSLPSFVLFTSCFFSFTHFLPQSLTFSWKLQGQVT